MQKDIIRIGLDIGIASVGWAVYGCDENGEPIKLLGLGSRIFDKAEQPKTGASLAEDRRVARGTRRRLRRRAERLRRLKALFEEHGVDVSFAGENVHALRARALDERVSENDFARILYLCCKNRGFKSNRKSEETSKETGELIKSAKANDMELMNGGYRTIGEMNYQKAIVDGDREYFDVHNHGKEYTHTVYRATIEKEIKLLFEKQREYGNSLASRDVEEEYLAIFNSQREYDEGPGKGSKYTADYKVGVCPYEGDMCCPKASWTQEWATSLQNLNNLRIVRGGESMPLSAEERELALAKMRAHDKITCAQLRTLLGLSAEDTFNISYTKPSSKNKRGDNSGEALTEKDYIEARNKTEKAKVISNLEKSGQIRKLLKDGHNSNDIVDEAAKVLSLAKSDSKRRAMFRSNEILKDVLDDEEIEALLGLNFDKFGALGFIATRKMIPYLEKGRKFNEALTDAGYKFNVFEGERGKLLKSKEIYDQLCQINSPVVKRSVSQTIKVINAIVLQYGSPIAVNIELARDMAKPFEKRKQIEADNKRRFEENQKFRDTFKARFMREPKGTDILRYRLYEEQRGKCVYSGEEIDLDMLFADNYYQIDHVMPFSKSFNDSYVNKVLVKTCENQNKGNRLPSEYICQDKSAEEYAAYVARVQDLYRYDFKKREILLKTKLDEDEWKSRALNDTRNISVTVSNIIDRHLLFDSRVDFKKRVYTYNGQMTAYVRRNWGIVKIREDGDLHHAVDAAVIACMTDGMRHRVEAYNKFKELRYCTAHIVDGEAFDPVTGEELRFEDRLPLPYPNFRKELLARTEEDPLVMRQKLQEIGYGEEEYKALSPAFVSRMAIHKFKGPIHKATIYSGKYYESHGVAVLKTELTSLRLTKDGKDIEGYFNKESDRRLYELLLDRLQRANGNAAEAFKDPVYKPLKDGGNGPVVKKVKIESRPTSIVKLGKVNGVADNGGQVRVDIFAKDKKYYCVPVYLVDAYKGVLPMRAIAAHKPYEEWTLIDGSYEFLFSLYPNELALIRNSRPFNLKKIKGNEQSALPDSKSSNEEFLYYNTINISSGAAHFEDVSGCYECDLGLKTVSSMEKYSVDVLGNIKRAGREAREPLRK